MKRILFIVTQSEFGGAQRYIFEVAKGLENRYEILIAAGQGNGELFDKLKIQNVKCKIFSLKHLKRVPWPWQMIFAIGEIYNLIKQEKPNIIFLCSTTAGILGSVAAKFIRNSQHSHKNSYHSYYVIYRIGGWAFRDPRPFWQNKILLWAEKLTASLKDKIIVNSEIDKEEAIKYKICSAEKIVKTHNGIDVNELEFLSKKEARQKLFITSPGLIIGTVANFYKTKGLPYLIEAVHILNSKFQILNSKFFIIGEGKERKKLEALIKKYRLKNAVFLLGKIPDAYKYLKAFDIFVLPSLKEGFPWIILEAMAAEIPIIATNVGAIPEIIEDEKIGILIKPKDPKILAEKILWLLNHLKEAKEMGIKAKEKLREFTLEKMVRETEKVLANH